MALIELEAAIKTLLEHGVATSSGTHLLKSLPTIDPIRAAGGCRCGECHWGQQDDLGIMHCHKYHIHKKPGGYCDDGEPKEAQDDG